MFRDGHVNGQVRPFARGASDRRVRRTAAHLARRPNAGFAARPLARASELRLRV